MDCFLKCHKSYAIVPICEIASSRSIQSACNTNQLANCDVAYIHTKFQNECIYYQLNIYTTRLAIKSLILHVYDANMQQY